MRRAPRADPAAGVVPVGAARVCVAALPAVMGEACPGPRRSAESGPAVSCAVRGAPNSAWRTAAGRVKEWRCRASRPVDADLIASGQQSRRPGGATRRVRGETCTVRRVVARRVSPVGLSSDRV